MKGEPIASEPTSNLERRPAVPTILERGPAPEYKEIQALPPIRPDALPDRSMPRPLLLLALLFASVIAGGGGLLYWREAQERQVAAPTPAAPPSPAASGPAGRSETTETAEGADSAATGTPSAPAGVAESRAAVVPEPGSPAPPRAGADATVAAAPDPEEQPAAGSEETRPAPQGEAAAEAADSSAPAEAAPSFDVVRVEPTGEALFAGRAAPDANVEILADGEVIARTTADAEGAFVAVPDAALPPGEHAIELRASGAAGQPAPQVAVNVPQPGSGGAAEIVAGAPEQDIAALPAPEIRQPEDGPAPRAAEAPAAGGNKPPDEVGGQAEAPAVETLPPAEVNAPQDAAPSDSAIAGEAQPAENEVPSDSEPAQAAPGDGEDLARPASGVAGEVQPPEIRAPSEGEPAQAAAGSSSEPARQTEAVERDSGPAAPNAAEQTGRDRTAPPPAQADTADRAPANAEQPAPAGGQGSEGGTAGSAETGMPPPAPAGQAEIAAIEPAGRDGRPGAPEPPEIPGSETRRAADPPVAGAATGTEPPVAVLPPEDQQASSAAPGAQARQESATSQAPAVTSAPELPGGPQVATPPPAARLPAAGQEQGTDLAAVPPLLQPPAETAPESGATAPAAASASQGAPQPRANDQASQEPGTQAAPAPGGEAAGPAPQIARGEAAATVSPDVAAGAADAGAVAARTTGELTTDPLIAGVAISAGEARPTNTEPGQIKAAAEAGPGQLTPDLSIRAAEAEADRLYVAGEAKPGSLVRVYAGGELIGEATTGERGAWLVEASKALPAGEVVIRADAVAENPAEPNVQVELPFVRHADGMVLEPLAGETATAAADPEADARLPPPTFVMIRRGDNLWRISRRNYGRGIRFKSIYAANNDRIRDPDLIYPGQVFVLPARDRNWDSAKN